MTDLQRLIKAVEKGNASRELFFAITDDQHFDHAESAYHGSLDAAKELHEALLPGWIFDVTNGSAFVCPPEYMTFDDPPDRIRQFCGESDVDARAWLIAILRAVEAGR